MKKYIIGFVIGSLLFGGIGIVSAYTLLAKDISYTPSWNKENGESINNVKDAIDELYDKSNKEFTTGLAFMNLTRGEGLKLGHNAQYNQGNLYLYNLDFTGIKSFTFSYSLTTQNAPYQYVIFSSAKNNYKYETRNSVANGVVEVNGANDINLNWAVADENTGIIKVLSYKTMDDIEHTIN